MLEKAEQMNHNRISTSVIKGVFSASTDDQMRHAMKQLEGENQKNQHFELKSSIPNFRIFIPLKINN